MEDRVGQVVRRAAQVGRDAVRGVAVDGVHIGPRDTEGFPHRDEVRAGRLLVAGDRHDVGVDLAQVDAERTRLLDDFGGTTLDPNLDGVEELAVHDVQTGLAQARGEHGGQAVHAGRDRPQALGTVVDRVHGRDHGEQHLRGADVRRGLLTADVLLTSLQREAVGQRAVGVDRDTHETAGQLALQPGPDGHVPGVRAAEADRHTETLRGADDDVRADLARRAQQRQREQVRDDDGLRARGVDLLDEGLLVAHHTGRAGVRQQHTEEVAAEAQALDALRQVRDHDLDAQRLGARLDDGQRLRQRVRVHDELVRLRAATPAHQSHRLGGGGRLVQHGRVRHRQAGQVADHGLEVQQRLETALRDLRLVRRVGRVPGGRLQHVAQDDARRDGVVVAEADHLRHRAVLGRQLTKLGQRLGLGGRSRQVEHEVALVNGRRHRVLGQLLQRSDADDVEDPRELGGARTDVAIGERGAVLESGERNAVLRHQTPPGAAGTRVLVPSPLCPYPEGRLRGSPRREPGLSPSAGSLKQGSTFQRRLAHAVLDA